MTEPVTLNQIFQVAFDKAKVGGWNPEETSIVVIEMDTQAIPILGVLFNHHFCKGLFGEEMINEKGDLATDANRDMLFIWQPAWKYHIKNMVLSDDPIEYLVMYLNEQAKS